MTYDTIRISTEEVIKMTEDRMREILKELEEKYTIEELKHIWVQLGFLRYQKQFYPNAFKGGKLNG
jgi:hypothetical protein